MLLFSYLSLMGIVKEEDKFIIRWPIRRKALAKFYTLKEDSIREILRDVGVNHNRTLSPNECARFFAHYGLPSENCDVKIPGVSIKVLKFGSELS